MGETALIDFLKKEDIEKSLLELLVDLADVASNLSRYISLGCMVSADTTRQPGINVHNEVQKPLDLIAHEMFINKLASGSSVRGIVSEELEKECDFESGDAPYLLIMDPLDGSSNIGINISIGSIFSILKCESQNKLKEEDFLKPGRQHICGGYFIYGPTTQLIFTYGRGIVGFTLDRDRSKFYLTNSSYRIPESTSEYAINASYKRHWHPIIRNYIHECENGEIGRRSKNFNTRWVASLVADVHRILNRGGVYLYPSDQRPGRAKGHLRLLYEAIPMAMLIEQAGGRITNGRENILDISPQTIHERTPLFFGAREEVEMIQTMFE